MEKRDDVDGATCRDHEKRVQNHDAHVQLPHMHRDNRLSDFIFLLKGWSAAAHFLQATLVHWRSHLFELKVRK